MEAQESLKHQLFAFSQIMQHAISQSKMALHNLSSTIPLDGDASDGESSVTSGISSSSEDEVVEAIDELEKVDEQNSEDESLTDGSEPDT